MLETVNQKRPPYLIISILMIGAFIAFLNNTLLNIAIPTMMSEFQVDASAGQWITTGFMLVNGVMIPTTAFLIQKYSVRRLFLYSMGMFTLGTLIAGFAPVFSVLIVARMIQASGSAIMMPLLMNVLLVSFPIERRGTAMGFFGFILMFAPAIGPTSSGWIVEHFGWRYLFYFIFPIAFTILSFGFFLLRDKKDLVDLRIDVRSLIFSSFGFGGVLIGFSMAGDKSWSHPLVYVPLAVGFVSLILFIRRQFSLEKPMLNFSIFKYPMFALGSAITMIVSLSMFSGMLLLPIYVQTVRGISPVDAGLLLLPGAIANAFMSPVTGRLFDKYGGRVLAVFGLLIITVGTYMLSRLDFETGYSYIMVLHAVRMLGISMVMMPVSTNGLNQLPKRLYPHGTAMNNTLNQVSGAIGTAVMITIMSIRQNHYYQRIIGQGGGAVSETGENAILREAMLGGINDSFFIASCFALIAFVLAFFIKRARPEDDSFSGQNLKRQKLHPGYAAEK